MMRERLHDQSQRVPPTDEISTAIVAYTEAIRLDPNFALAFSGRSIALTTYAGEGATGAAVRESYEKAASDARQSVALAPGLAEGHLALANMFETGTLDWLEVHELHEVVGGELPGRQSDEDVIVFKSNGIAAWDIAAAAKAVELARESGVGTEL